jgi:hypothetical protein
MIKSLIDKHVQPCCRSVPGTCPLKPASHLAYTQCREGAGPLGLHSNPHTPLLLSAAAASPF